VANHKAAMELSGAWDPGVIGSLTPDQKPLPDLSYFPFPTIEGGQGGVGAMMGGADGYSCSAWAPQPACNEFLNYLVSTPVAKAYSKAFESVSTNKVAQASSAASDPIVKAELTAANKAPYSSLWLDTLFGSNVGNAFNTAVVNLLAGTGTVADIVSAASDANAKG
jgi:raffinose/stachyose/melibiose transport system substrate-binding protein